MGIDRAGVERAVLMLLHAIGEDPSRDGLCDTPARVARFWEEFIDGPEPTTVSFEHQSTDDLVVVSGMEVFSLCEHHLLPIKATVTIGYMPAERILGLSKFGRIAQQVAHKLQVQERMTAQIADAVQATTECSDVAVIATGEHMCMTMRGVKMPAYMTTSVLRGRFRELPAVRAEFMSLARRP